MKHQTLYLCLLSAIIGLLLGSQFKCCENNTISSISADTTSKHETKTIEPPAINTSAEAKTIIKYKNKIVYRDNVIIDSSLRADSLSITANADTTIISPVKVGDSTYMDTTRITAAYTFPADKINVGVLRNNYTYENITKTITKTVVVEKEPSIWEKIGIAAGFTGLGAIIGRASK